MSKPDDDGWVDEVTEPAEDASEFVTKSELRDILSEFLGKGDEVEEETVHLSTGLDPDETGRLTLSDVERIAEKKVTEALSKLRQKAPAKKAAPVKKAEPKVETKEPEVDPVEPGKRSISQILFGVK